MLKKILLSATVACLSCGAFAQDQAYAETLRKMFAVSGSEQSYHAVISQMVDMFKKQYPQVEAGYWDSFEKEFMATSLNDLVEMLIPVYYKYLTREDLEGMIKFYDTPIGKKYAQSTPLILQESMLVGQTWGMKVAEDFQRKMDAEKH